MEMDVRSRRSRDTTTTTTTTTSPDRIKMCIEKPKIITKPIKKVVQVVYYLSRNGQLEHPHFMEVTHFSNHNLRLRDVIDKLTVLRGKGMPSLYSWSCKRSYKNGYVWNDLSDNDILHPSEGAEYVLKGTELVQGCSSERFQRLNLQKRCIKRVNLVVNRENQETGRSDEQQEDDEEEEYEDEEKKSFSSSTTNTTTSRCSRGVFTDEEPQKTPTESTHPNSSKELSVFQKPTKQSITTTPKRFEDGDPVEFEPSRNSVLLQLIACGSFAVNKAKNVANSKQLGMKNIVVRSSSDLQKEVLCKSAMKVVEEDMITYMSENPRFGNSQAEEKEYFSGSIVESMSDDRVLNLPGKLKRSNSYNEERGAKAGLDLVAEAVKEESRERRMKEKTLKAKCIPIKRPSSLKQHKK